MSTAATRTRTVPTRLLIVGAAVVAALIVWGVAELAGMDLRQPPLGSGSATDLTIGWVVAASAIPALVGWALLALFESFTAKARGIWTTVALIFLLISFGGPLSGTGITTGNRLVLVCEHVVVGGIVITGMARTATGR